MEESRIEAIRGESYVVTPPKTAAGARRDRAFVGDKRAHPVHPPVGAPVADLPKPWVVVIILIGVVGGRHLE